MEAEWEYAAPATTTGDLYGAIWRYCVVRRQLRRRAPSGGWEQPNRWGLYDMIGNVLEFVQDRLRDYPATPVADPTGPARSSFHSVRGGFFLGVLPPSVTGRRQAIPVGRSERSGFRLA